MNTKWGEYEDLQITMITKALLPSNSNKINRLRILYDLRQISKHRLYENYHITSDAEFLTCGFNYNETIMGDKITFVNKDTSSYNKV